MKCKSPSTPQHDLLTAFTPFLLLPPCQVAVGRTVYTMVKDTCLAGRSAKSLSMEARNRLVAFLCTFLGGPALTKKRCKFSDPSTGKQLLTLNELYSHMHLVHQQ